MPEYLFDRKYLNVFRYRSQPNIVMFDVGDYPSPTDALEECIASYELVWDGNHPLLKLVNA